MALAHDIVIETIQEETYPLVRATVLFEALQRSITKRNGRSFQVEYQGEEVLLKRGQMQGLIVVLCLLTVIPGQQFRKPPTIQVSVEPKTVNVEVSTFYESADAAQTNALHADLIASLLQYDVKSETSKQISPDGEVRVRISIKRDELETDNSKS
jgi:hypothetical protein